MLSIGTIEYEVGRYSGRPIAYYWKLKNSGYPLNGPFPTEDAAKAAAVKHFEEIKAKVLSGGKSTL